MDGNWHSSESDRKADYEKRIILLVVMQILFSKSGQSLVKVMFYFFTLSIHDCWLEFISNYISIEAATE